MDIIISTLSSLIQFIKLTDDISQFKHFLIDELTTTISLIQKTFSQHNQPLSPPHHSNDNNSVSFNKYDKYISKAKSIITKYQQSIHSNPSLTDRTEHTVDHINVHHLSSSRNNNISSYQLKKERTTQHVSSLLDVNNDNNKFNYRKSYTKYKPHMKKGIPSNKRRELILSLNNIDTLLTNTSISNNKHCRNNNNNNNNTKITNEHIRQKSTELTELFTYINSNEKLNSRLEKVFGNEYVSNIINSDINDNYIDKVRNEAKSFLNNNNTTKPLSIPKHKQIPLSPHTIHHNIPKSIPKKSYADELLNTTNALHNSPSIITHNNITTSKHYNTSKSNTNIFPTHHKSKTTETTNTFRNSNLNKPSYTIKPKVHAK
jgi:hypothetical protein